MVANGSEKKRYKLGFITKLSIYAMILFLFGISQWWLFHLDRVHTLEVMKSIAYTSVQKDYTFRKWVASHGGIYVPVTEKTPPNRLLTFIKNRDVTINGKPYTTMNPAYALRQLTNDYKGIYSAKGHITSLKPINPDNKPDAWEVEALKSFENGAKEAAGSIFVNGKEFYRYMIPLYTEKECLKCHKHQGYKEGDIRGGLSTNIPMQEFKEIMATTASHTFTVYYHLFFLIIILGLTHFLLRKIELDTTKDIEKESLELLNAKLHEKVEKTLERNRAQEQLLYQQSKSAQMGEMVSMIAHQWRQPLNAMNSSAIAISLKNAYKSIEYNEIENHAQFIQDQTQNMSNIINDFMDFLKPDHEAQEFFLDETVQSIRSLIHAQLSARGITLECHECHKLKIQTYQKELEHVLLNIIINARDAFAHKEIEDKRITLTFKDMGEDIYICIKDNAGGIPEDILPNIFDPYFTTKEVGEGTGIGLYMVKKIVHEILQGSVHVINEDDGARFCLIFKNR